MFQDDHKPSFLTVGTPQCAAFCGALVLVFAVLLLTVGFWKTLLLAVFVLLGLFIGGVKDKQRFLQEKLSALIPSGEKKSYRPTAYPAGVLVKKSAVPEAPDEEEDAEPEDEAADEDGEAADEAEEEKDAEEESPAEAAAAEADEAAEDEEASDEDGESAWKAGPETKDGRLERTAGENR